MTLDAATLRRQIADHKRALVELKAALAEIEGRANGLDRVEALRRHCLAIGVDVLPDDLVRANDAAKLIGKKAKTLANWRDLEDDRLPWVMFDDRPCYALQAVAAYLWHD